MWPVVERTIWVMGPLPWKQGIFLKGSTIIALTVETWSFFYISKTQEAEIRKGVVLEKEIRILWRNGSFRSYWVSRFSLHETCLTEHNQQHYYNKDKRVDFLLYLIRRQLQLFFNRNPKPLPICCTVKGCPLHTNNSSVSQRSCVPPHPSHLQTVTLNNLTCQSSAWMCHAVIFDSVLLPLCTLFPMGMSVDLSLHRSN